MGGKQPSPRPVESIDGLLGRARSTFVVLLAAVVAVALGLVALTGLQGFPTFSASPIPDPPVQRNAGLDAADATAVGGARAADPRTAGAGGGPSGPAGAGSPSREAGGVPTGDARVTPGAGAPAPVASPPRSGRTRPRPPTAPTAPAPSDPAPASPAPAASGAPAPSHPGRGHAHGKVSSPGNSASKGNSAAPPGQAPGPAPGEGPQGQANGQGSAPSLPPRRAG